MVYWSRLFTSMSPTKKIPQIIGVAASLAISCISTFAADPQLESWQTANTRRYARIYQTDAARLAGTAVTTWTLSSATPNGGNSWANTTAVTPVQAAVTLKSGGAVSVPPASYVILGFVPA